VNEIEAEVELHPVRRVRSQSEWSAGICIELYVDPVE
jgi:hypothetical protein